MCSSDLSPLMAGQRLTNQRVSYGSGASSPPTQNGQATVLRLSGRFGRVWRVPTTCTIVSRIGSMRGFVSDTASFLPPVRLRTCTG